MKKKLLLSFIVITGLGYENSLRSDQATDLKTQLTKAQADLATLNASAVTLQEQIKTKQGEITDLETKIKIASQTTSSRLTTSSTQTSIEQPEETARKKIESAATALESSLNGGINYYFRQQNPTKFNKEYMRGRWKYYDIDKKMLDLKTIYNTYVEQYGQNKALVDRILVIENSCNEAKSKIEALT